MLNALTVCLTVALAAEPSHSDIDAAATALAEGRVRDALRSLEAVGKQNDLSRDVYLDFIEFQAVALVQLKKDAQAEKLFAILASLDPERMLRPYATGKARALFLNSVSSQKARLELLNGKATLDPTTRRVVQITARVKGDKLGLARKVRFHIRSGNGEWKVADADVVERYASTSTNAERLVWYAELLGERNAVLALSGADGEPWVEPPDATDAAATTEAPPPVATPSPIVTPAPAPAAVEPAAVQVASENTGSALRPASYVVGGVGVAAAVTGIVFGVLSAGERSKLETAKANAMGGVITDLTQYDAYKADGMARRYGIAANALWIGGGAAVVTAVILFIVGAPAEPAQASLSVGPSGVAVYGQF